MHIHKLNVREICEISDTFGTSKVVNVCKLPYTIMHTHAVNVREIWLSIPSVSFAHQPPFEAHYVITKLLSCP